MSHAFFLWLQEHRLFESCHALLIRQLLAGPPDVRADSPLVAVLAAIDEAMLLSLPITAEVLVQLRRAVSEAKRDYLVATQALPVQPSPSSGQEYSITSHALRL